MWLMWMSVRASRQRSSCSRAPVTRECPSPTSMASKGRARSLRHSLAAAGASSSFSSPSRLSRPTGAPTTRSPARITSRSGQYTAISPWLLPCSRWTASSPGRISPSRTARSTLAVRVSASASWAITRAPVRSRKAPASRSWSRLVITIQAAPPSRSSWARSDSIIGTGSKRTFPSSRTHRWPLKSICRSSLKTDQQYVSGKTCFMTEPPGQVMGRRRVSPTIVRFSDRIGQGSSYGKEVPPL